ncbi:S-adenosyl-L-methionine-dependentmethyltransferases superfamily protein [Striga asiatica]|uniref:S-adenosyl-L-methionine-dependentmethyltransferases superfamily protein n=1 Tax=Striga asiatica TaxID=4170 RepID=A0A5A7PVR6_STRAF|nr:S-adenosyl-L-methionine-dependentmethyltransferases superfamily protein [Striga asiatica]
MATIENRMGPDVIFWPRVLIIAEEEASLDILRSRVLIVEGDQVTEDPLSRLVLSFTKRKASLKKKTAKQLIPQSPCKGTPKRTPSYPNKELECNALFILDELAYF